MAILGSIFTSLFTFLGTGLKNPIFLKLATFTFFISLLNYAVDFFLSYVNFDLISDSQFFAIASYFGLISALITFIKLLISIFFANQIIIYFRN